MATFGVYDVVGEMGMKKILFYDMILLNAIISILFLIFSVNANILNFIFSIYCFVMILTVDSKNILFFLRNFFIGIVCYIPILAKLINPDALFSSHNIEVQTLEIASIIFYCGNIALTSSEFGFLLSKNTLISLKFPKFLEFKQLIWPIILLFIVVSIIIDLSHGPDILSVPGYAHPDVQKLEIGLNILNAIVNILLFYIILFYYKYHFYFTNNIGLRYVIILSALYLLLYVYILHGVRMDFLNAVIGLFVLMTIYRDKLPKLKFSYVFLGVILFIVIQFVGHVRSRTMEVDLINILSEIVNSLYISKHNVYFYQGTINDIINTFSTLIYIIELRIVDYIHGKSYFEYILRTPPEFIYPDRPEDLAWIFTKFGYSSGGGFFELAEAYYNFGIIGVIIMPFLISFYIGISYKYFLNNKFSLLYSLPFFTILAVFLRGILYQTFAFYKGFITGIVLFSIFLILNSWLRVFTKKNYISL